MQPYPSPRPVYWAFVPSHQDSAASVKLPAPQSLAPVSRGKYTALTSANIRSAQSYLVTEYPGLRSHAPVSAQNSNIYTDLSSKAEQSTAELRQKAVSVINVVIP